MLAVPAATGVTTPELEITAIVASPVDHVPPGDVLDNVVVSPVQTVVVPVIVAGVA